MSFPTSSNSIIDHIFNPPKLIHTYVAAKINWRKTFRLAMPNRKITFVEPEDISTLISSLDKAALSITPVEFILYQSDQNPTLDQFCKENNIPLYYLDPGLYAFLHTNSNRPPFNFIGNQATPYWYHTPESTLISAINATDLSKPDQQDNLQRARAVIDFVKNHQISKFNDRGTIPINQTPNSTRKKVLIVGENPSKQSDPNQDLSDLHVIKAAKRDYPLADLIYKLHPFDQTPEDDPALQTIQALVTSTIQHHQSVDSLLSNIDVVYTISSQLGFDALLRGIPVVTFGQPWYAGWGLTKDHHSSIKLVANKTLEDLVAAVCFGFTYGFDWDTKISLSVEDSLKKLYALKLPYAEEADQLYLLKEARTALKNLDFQVAQKHLDTLVTMFPSYIEGYTCYAELCFLQQKYDQAVHYLTQAIDIKPSAVLYQERCMARLKNGEFSSQTDDDFLAALQSSKSKNNLLYQYFAYKWEKEPISDVLFKQLDHALESVPQMQKTSKEYGKLLLLKACMLNESGQKSTAVKIQKQALAVGAVDSTMLALRHTAWKYGNTKALSDYEATYYPKLLEFTNRFRELVLAANGSVCLVGNAPSLIGQNRGAEIDQHQLVVRFNNYSTDYPFSEDYGIKTDVWVRMPFHPYVKRDVDPDVKLVMFTGSNRLYRPYTEWNGILEYIERGFPVQFFPSATLYELQKALGCPPTAGLTLCYMLYKILGPLRPEQCLGFSFTDPANAQGSYHYSDQNAASSARHDWDREAEFFDTIRQKDPTKVVVPLALRQKGQDRRLAMPADIATSAPTVITAPRSSVATDTPTAAAQPNYDRIISVSPGLADYQIYGKKVELISGAKTERHLKWLENPLKGEAADVLRNLQPNEKVCVLGFGRAKTGLLAKQLAQALHADFRLVEYGLISAMSLPSEKKFNFSLILDDCGIFYDTTVPSQIENMLLRDDDILQPAMLQRSRKLIDTIVSNNITKYNNSGDVELITARKNHRILVIDQTAGDNAIVYGQCETYSFRDMLLTALDQPNSDVILKIHPETAAGAKDGNLTSIQDLLDRPNLKVIGQQCNIVSLIKQVDEVYVMTSGVGLEALMVGKPVSCFGVPFYSGWGLTNDRVPVKNPRRQLSVESLFAATFLKYNLFYHPETQQPCSMDDCIEWIVKNKPFFEPIKLEW
jgi:capsule polysaccharide export protein KpsC/LpsZ